MQEAECMFLSTVLAGECVPWFGTKNATDEGNQKSASSGMADNATRARELAAVLSRSQVLVNGNGSSFLSAPTNSNRDAASNSTAIAVMPLPRLPSTSRTNDAPCCASAGTARTNAGPNS